mgnify:CR=1 FL=1
MLTRERPSIEGPTSEIGLSGSEEVTESRTASILESARGETELSSRKDFRSPSMSLSSSRTPKSLDSNLGSPFTLEKGNSKGETNIKARTRVSLVEPFRSFPEYGSGSILESTS